MDRWSLKIHAFLHDPPHKPLALGRGHGRQGAAIAAELTGEEADDTTRELIKKADHLAAGADRYNWLRDLTVNPATELQLIHPLEGKPIFVPGTATGRPLELFFPAECVDKVANLAEEIPAALEEIEDTHLRFLLLWRFLPELLSELEGKRGTDSSRLGLLWPLLPADSRMPDHSVLIHDSLVSALASILQTGQEAALLRVQFAPVQEFIQASRKLRDLWASSSILAETAWMAMQPVVEKFGPDHVLFPSLRYEPRFDRWLLEQLQGRPCRANEEKQAGHRALWEVVKEAERHLARALRTPSLPNLFTAVVPLNEARQCAEEIQSRLRQAWGDQVGQAAAKADSGHDCCVKASGSRDGEESQAAKPGAGHECYVKRAQDQTRALLQVFWSVVPWPLDESPREWNASPAGTWHKEKPLVSDMLKTANQLTRAAAGGYEPNAGLLYADLNDQATLLVDATKRERIQAHCDEGGFKCSCCGERQVLGGHDFWIQRTEGLAKRADKDVLSENEQLCGPCTWKRTYEPPVLDGKDSMGQRHPSTGEIAAAQFKLDLIRACSDGNTKLLREVETFVKAVEEDVRRGAIEEADQGIFCPQAVDLAAYASGRQVLQDFAHIDGQWLLEFPREEGENERAENTIRAARALRKAAKDTGIDPPRPYLAVVDFDGDEMGKWLSGTHCRFPSVSETLHTRALEQMLANQSGEAGKLKGKRFLTPGFHASISAAAATFARFAVPMTVEGEGLPGHLVYAGGDDALFLAPIPVALELALRLRLRFSGWPSGFGSSVLRDGREAASTLREELLQRLRHPRPWTTARLRERGLPEPPDWWGEADRLGLAFGTRATASVGICVFHYRWPLGSALREARRALEEAKERGRNAIGIVIQRRSGSVSRTVLPFWDQNGRQKEEKTQENQQAGGTCLVPALSLLELTHCFAAGDRVVSPRLATAFRQEISALHVEPVAGKLASRAASTDKFWEVAQALAKRVIRRREINAQKQLVPEFERIVLELGEGVRRAHMQDDVHALFAWSEALTVAAFLARAGERG